MFLAVGMRRAALVVLLGAALSVGCGGRWVPPKNYDLPTQMDAQASYAAVLEVANQKRYQVVSRDDVGRKARLQAQSSDKSFILVEIYAGDVRLVAAGSLVREGKVHRSLAKEMDDLESDLRARLGSGTGATPGAVPGPPQQAPQPVAASAGMPQAWSEPAYDPTVWGNGNFTCLPVRVPPEHQSALSLQLSNGERADLQLSLAYAPELCRSPAQCKQPGGCPALGIGDSERVSRIAGRLSRQEIGAQATLFDGPMPVATIDLMHHGSVVQAMSEIKH